MSTIASSSSPLLISGIRPSFAGLVRSALRKIWYLRLTWFMLAICLAFTLIGFALALRTITTTTGQPIPALEQLYIKASTPWIVTRSLSGIFQMVITAYLIGVEYQRGTIRIILARGIGRVQLLLSQLTAVLIVGLLLLCGWAIINILGSFFIAQSADVLKAANPEFWREMGLYVLTILINMIITTLMAVAMAAIGRSLTFGMTAALSWFAVDNTIGFTLQLLAASPHNDFFNKLAGFLLGPILNVLPQLIGLNQLLQQGNFVNLSIGGTQALLTILAYGVLFLMVSLLVTWKKDIKE
jgi:ABC-2 type transport system permease protein